MIGLVSIGVACGGADQTAFDRLAGDDFEAALQLLRDTGPGEAPHPGRAAERPRLVAPLSGSISGSARPVFHWAGPRVGVVQLCADRACARSLGGFVAVGQTTRAPRALVSGVVFWRLLTLGPRLSIQATAAWELLVPPGAGAAPEATRGLRFDVNGDGYVDAAIRELNSPALSDQLLVFAGGPEGIDPGRQTRLALDTTHFGVGLSAAGDVNGDGFGDVAVADGRGVVIYAGSATGPMTVPLTVLPPPPGINEVGFGFELSAAGDVNRDGYGDLVVADGNVQVWLYAGGPAGLSRTPAWSLDRRGVVNRFVRLMTTGDLNGDGFGDLIVTDYGPDDTPQGFRYFRGGVTGLESSAGGTLIARPTFPSGTSTDVNGDGVMDLVTAEGTTLAFFPGGLGFPAPQPTQELSLRTRPGPLQAGDFDGDGLFDLAVTLSTPTSSAFFTDNAIEVYRGGAAGLMVTPSQTLVEAGLLPDNQLNFGLALAGGDLNKDGREDLLVGSPPPFPTPFFETSASAAFVFPGTAGGVEPRPSPRLDGMPGFGLSVSAGAP